MSSYFYHYLNIYNLESFEAHTFANLGFWEYFVKFSLDKFINGPSGLVSMEAYERKERKEGIENFLLK